MMSAARSRVAGPFMKKNLSLWNVTNYRVTDSPHYMAKFTIPGLSHESFDNDGNPKITSLMITSVMSRSYALNRPDEMSEKGFLDWPEVVKDRYTFVSSTEFRISKDLYDTRIPKWPLDAKFCLGNVGNSSVANVIEFFAHGEEKVPLWTNVTQLVAVDMATRKPTALPEWFKDKYKGKGCMDKGFIIRSFDRPPITFCHQMQVNWSDTDNYKHTNFASYVRFGLDALHAALLEGKETSSENPDVSQEPVSTNNSRTNYSQTEVNGTSIFSKALQGISEKKIANGLKNVQINYLNESVEGQILNAHVWQQAGQENVVWCSIERGTEDICQIKFEYFSTDELSDSIHVPYSDNHI